MIRLFSLLTVLLLFPFTSNAVTISTDAKQAIAIDFETGDILLSKNTDERMPTSSMSKVMTMVVVFDALKTGEIKLDEEFLVSEKAWRKGGSKMFIEVDKRVKVEDLIRGVIIQSGNDATITLAEGLSGSEEAFVGRMNKKAEEIGMHDSHFRNASGWPDPEHYSTAADLAKLGRYLVQNYNEYYSYYAEKEFEFNDIKQPNRNPLLYRNIGADGIKTGHTDAGGYGLIGSGERDGRRVIMVLNGMESSQDRAQNAARVLDWALGRFENKSIAKTGDILEQAPVKMGKEETVAISVAQDVMLTIPKAASKDLKTTINYPRDVMAPIQAGQEVGVLSIHINENETREFPVVAASAVEEKGFVGKLIEQGMSFIKDKL